mmetsp:Transcript_92881/g.298817  ORF Transcript_92881/g.298817 Transcript_92881/m.298817 type:complete len:203 (-) Transcript_92881:120-728(-)
MLFRRLPFVSAFACANCSDEKRMLERTLQMLSTAVLCWAGCATFDVVEVLLTPGGRRGLKLTSAEPSSPSSFLSSRPLSSSSSSPTKWPGERSPLSVAPSPKISICNSARALNACCCAAGAGSRSAVSRTNSCITRVWKVVGFSSQSQSVGIHCRLLKNLKMTCGVMRLAAACCLPRFSSKEWMSCTYCIFLATMVFGKSCT